MPSFFQTAGADFDALAARQARPLKIGNFSLHFSGIIFSAQKIAFSAHPRCFIANWTRFHDFNF